ncbi:MAG: hypothetical protein JWO15_1530 [Sphingomonadales bacterium]|nr:hypothetical protein [Sphingomonadales bacterium]
MSAIMIVYMNIHDTAWIGPYFAEVPKLLTEYGAISMAGARGDIVGIEGNRAPPDRIAIFTFPSVDAVDRFMTDERYQAYRQLRESGATSEIFVFENSVADGALV